MGLRRFDLDLPGATEFTSLEEGLPEPWLEPPSALITQGSARWILNERPVPGHKRGTPPSLQRQLLFGPRFLRL